MDGESQIRSWTVQNTSTHTSRSQHEVLATAQVRCACLKVSVTQQSKAPESDACVVRGGVHG
eukprot:4572820-Pyramimonas_sp.AAC.1